MPQISFKWFPLSTNERIGNPARLVAWRSVDHHRLSSERFPQELNRDQPKGSGEHTNGEEWPFLRNPRRPFTNLPKCRGRRLT